MRAKTFFKRLMEQPERERIAASFQIPEGTRMLSGR
jgi:hypothetical protein